MQIHVVKPSESLFDISIMYSLPISLLEESNKIQNPGNLVPGQTIVIPIWGSYYFVQNGDTIESISEKVGIDVETIAKINGIDNLEELEEGDRLYIPQKERETKQISIYLDTDITGENSVNELEEVAKEISDVNIFSYKVNNDGTLEPTDDDEIITVSLNNNVKPVMVVTNLKEGQFDQQLATEILSNEAVQDKLLDEIIETMKTKGYKGLDFDFEYLGAENKERYANFLRKAKERTEEEGFTLSVALAPKNSDDQKGVLYEGHDYETIGTIVDYILSMTYEWGWSGGPPRPVAPIDEVRKVLTYATSIVPADKVMMGIPLYGYDWTLPYEKGGKFAKSISPQRAIELAVENGVEIQYDEEAQAPFFEYIDEEGKAHIVWFEDARSIQAKFDLANELGLRGVFYWVMGRDFPQNWLLVEDNFIVEK